MISRRVALPIIADSPGPEVEVGAPAAETSRRRTRVLMVHPLQGFSGVFVQHMPLSLLYASADLVKRGVPVDVFDARLHASNWRDELRARLSDETLLVGLTVMTGRPIEHAIELGRFVKSIDPGIKVVWGGPHATFAPDSILDEWSCDYAISGYGNAPFNELVQAISEGREDLSHIRGVSFRRGAERVRVPEVKAFEKLSHHDIPYHLIKDYTPYGQLDSGRKVFSMYSVLGCPYKCTFCSSPAQYKGTVGKTWVPIEVSEVIEHIEFVMERYGADFIYFIDDDSFVNLAHVEGIIDAIKKRGLHIKLGFRGARINEIKKMSHAYLSKLAAAGTDILHVGAESGSDRILKMIKKNCTVEDILECNRKLAQHPEFTVGYNFMIGLPSETLEELHATRDLWLRLMEDNPRAIIFTPNKFRPLPGTELFDVAVSQWNYSPPRTLAEWTEIELETDQAFPWYPEGMEQLCRLLFISSHFVDGKIFRFSKGVTPLYRMLRTASRLYAPMARWRLKNGRDELLVEYDLYQWAKRTMLDLQSGHSALWKMLQGDAAVGVSP